MMLILRPTERPPEARGRLALASLSARASHRQRHFQIGPRIRIGGTVGKIGQNVKNAVTKGVTDTGHFVGEAASNPWVKGLTAAALAATGVGAPLAAGIMGAEGLAGGALAPHGGLKAGLVGGAEGAAMGYGASKVGDLLYNGIGSIGAEPGAAGVVAPTSMANIGKRAIGAVLGGSGGGAGGATGDLGSTIGGAISGATGGLVGGAGGMSPLDLALAGLATAQGVNAAKASARAGQFQDKALNLAENNWAAGAPLRAAGVSGLTTPAKVNLSNTYANPTNPFAARRIPLALPTTAGVAA